VNILSPPKARLVIEVVHDLICPWCYLGVRRLFRTLTSRPDLLVELEWRAFLLNPDMPRGGMPRGEYVARKFGGEERARRLYASITDLGAAEGLNFRFDRIRRTPSSVNAHRLVRLASRVGCANAVVESLFAAHFTDGRDIGDPAVLTAIAAACGMRPNETRQYIESEAELEQVHGDNLRAHRLGINGVPCFVVGGQHAIAGAQEPEVIERLLDVAAVEQTGLS
jgi:predicted DsbA family dithiol-disulfide isomerase